MLDSGSWIVSRAAAAGGELLMFVFEVLGVGGVGGGAVSRGKEGGGTIDGEGGSAMRD